MMLGHQLTFEEPSRKVVVTLDALHQFNLPQVSRFERTEGERSDEPVRG